ncbi:MAG: TIGR00296 family protein [Nitrososphaerota archaeon]|nr:TIGR00296 family protein [Nitrososphaerota archaeon]
MAVSLEEGRRAVALARETLEAHVKHARPSKQGGDSGLLAEKRGVFVTLNVQEAGVKHLRGCIGYPQPIKPLGDAIRDVTVYASEDPRFPSPVDPGELDRIVVEVSILTLPEVLTAPRRQDFPSMIRIGRDGLIVSNRNCSGLLLPQVATEQGWDQDTFLAEACEKAGLPMDAWLDNATNVQTFQADIFSESRPRGDVTRADPATRN